MTRRLVRGCWVPAVVAGLFAAPAARAQHLEDPLDRPAVQTHRAAHSVLLGVTRAGGRLVAVGERGIIVCSDDDGRTWSQARVPTSVSLTAVHFADPAHGWAVGHGGVVLHTKDRGETWTRQLDGNAAAALALRAAEARVRAAPNDAEARASLRDAQRLVADGADKPFLDVHFADVDHGFVVGAYGLTFHTDDGGSTWHPWMDRLDNPKGLHLNAIRAAGKLVYLAGEQGLFFRSTDRGRSFQRLETPYSGSYAVAAITPEGDVVLGGLRGHAYRSRDQGRSFELIEVPVPISFSAAAVLPDHSLAFGNVAGDLLRSVDGGRTMRPASARRIAPIAALAAGADGSLIAVGTTGVVRLPGVVRIPTAAASATTQGDAR
jgi:photosystem II stability/assembly factor-like uncharacterized protein